MKKIKELVRKAGEVERIEAPGGAALRNGQHQRERDLPGFLTGEFIDLREVDFNPVFAFEDGKGTKIADAHIIFKKTKSD